MRKFILFSLLFFTLFSFMNLTSYASEIESKGTEEFEKKNLSELINNLYKSTGVHEFFNPEEGKLDADKKSAMSLFNQTWGRAIMIIIAFCLFYLTLLYSLALLYFLFYHMFLFVVVFYVILLCFITFC